MEEKNKIKKGLLGIVTILLIAMILTWITILILQNNPQNYLYVKKVNSITKAYKNYEVIVTTKLYNEQGQNTTSTIGKIERKNDVKKVMSLKEDGSIIATAWQTKDKIILEEAKTILPSTFLSDDLNVLEEFISNKDKYEYLKNEIYNNTECIVVQFSAPHRGKTIAWIDADRKVIVKQEKYNEKGTLQYEASYDVKLDCMQENQLKLPDTTGYTYKEN